MYFFKRLPDIKKRKLNVIQLATLSYNKQKCPFVTRNQFSKETG